MLHTKFQASEASGFEEKNYLIFSYVLLRFHLGPTEAGSFLTPRPSFKQTCYMATKQCYLSSFEYLNLVI